MWRYFYKEKGLRREAFRQLRQQSTFVTTQDAGAVGNGSLNIQTAMLLQQLFNHFHRYELVDAFVFVTVRRQGVAGVSGMLSTTAARAARARLTRSKEEADWVCLTSSPP